MMSFNFADISARYAHAICHVTLREAVRLAQDANSSTHVQAVRSVRLLICNHTRGSGCISAVRASFLPVKRLPALSAKIVAGPELDEMAMVATDHFPGIACNRGSLVLWLSAH